MKKSELMMQEALAQAKREERDRCIAAIATLFTVSTKGDYMEGVNAALVMIDKLGD